MCSVPAVLTSFSESSILNLKYFHFSPGASAVRWGMLCSFVGKGQHLNAEPFSQIMSMFWYSLSILLGLLCTHKSDLTLLLLLLFPQ